MLLKTYAQATKHCLLSKSFTINMDIFIDALSQSILFFPLALGIYISYVILRATDLTVDGSFVLGAAYFCPSATLFVPHLFWHF